MTPASTSAQQRRRRYGAGRPRGRWLRSSPSWPRTGRASSPAPPSMSTAAGSCTERGGSGDVHDGLGTLPVVAVAQRQVRRDDRAAGGRVDWAWSTEKRSETVAPGSTTAAASAGSAVQSGGRSRRTVAVADAGPWLVTRTSSVADDPGRRPLAVREADHEVRIERLVDALRHGAQPDQHALQLARPDQELVEHRAA